MPVAMSPSNAMHVLPWTNHEGSQISARATWHRSLTLDRQHAHVARQGCINRRMRLAPSKNDASKWATTRGRVEYAGTNKLRAQAKQVRCQHGCGELKVFAAPHITNYDVDAAMIDGEWISCWPDLGKVGRFVMIVAELKGIEVLWIRDPLQSFNLSIITRRLFFTTASCQLQWQAIRLANVVATELADTNGLQQCPFHLLKFPPACLATFIVLCPRLLLVSSGS